MRGRWSQREVSFGMLRGCAKLTGCSFGIRVALCFLGLIGLVPGMVRATHAAAELRTNIPADPAQIEPITQSELIASDIIANMYEGFTAINPDGMVIPALAIDWHAHEDGLGFRFHLRRGVRFHSGREFTARDVKFSFEQLLIPANRGGAHTRYLKNVIGAQEMRAGRTAELEGVRLIDDYTVDIRFTVPEVLFPIYPLTFIDSAVLQNGGLASLTTQSAGTGPFRLKHWRRGQEVRLARHEDYWNGSPQVDEVAFVIVPNGHTAVSMFEAGELDLVYAEPGSVRRILRDRGFDGLRLRAAAAQIQYLGMNQSLYPPFTDVRVREAVCRAIDREAMAEGLESGAAQPLHGQTAPHVAGYNPDVPRIEYDPELARRLLRDAGYPGGTGLPELKVTGTAPNKYLLVYIAYQLNAILNMPVTIELLERGSFIMNLNAGNVAFFPWGWAADYPDAMYFLGQVWYGPSVYNRSRWKNAQFDRLIEQARQTVEDPERYALYAAAEHILLDDWGTCPLIVREQIALKKPYVHGVQLTPFRFLPFRDAEVVR